MTSRYDIAAVSQRLRERGASDRAHTMALELLSRGYGIGEVVTAANRVQADEGRAPIELSGLLAGIQHPVSAPAAGALIQTRVPAPPARTAAPEAVSDRVLATMFGPQDLALSAVAEQILAAMYGPRST